MATPHSRALPGHLAQQIFRSIQLLLLILMTSQWIVCSMFCLIRSLICQLRDRTVSMSFKRPSSSVGASVKTTLPWAIACRKFSAFASWIHKGLSFEVRSRVLGAQLASATGLVCELVEWIM